MTVIAHAWQAVTQYIQYLQHVVHLAITESRLDSGQCHIMHVIVVCKCAVKKSILPLALNTLCILYIPRIMLTG